MISLLTGDCRSLLADLASGSISCCITSPPYWGLRDYGLPPSTWGGDPDCPHEWEEETRAGLSGGTNQDGKTDRPRTGTYRPVPPTHHAFCGLCGCWRGSLGLEPTVGLYVQNIVAVLRGVHRVLENTGTLWLNLGDSYYGDSPCRTRSSEAFSETWDKTQTRSRGGNRRSAARQGFLKPKDLCGIPWRVAIALQDAGWWLRSDIIWAKPNPLPESVRDRPTRSHEYVFLLTKQAKYWYDAAAIREPFTTSAKEGYPARARTTGRGSQPSSTASLGGAQQDQSGGYPTKATGRNKRTVWNVNVRPWKGAHTATFPPLLIEPMVLAGCPPSGTILDPFGGSGTVGVVAQRLGRSAVLMDLNPAYTTMASGRIFR